MLKEERKQTILEYLENNQVAKTNSLSNKLGVSLSTIRRDFNEIASLKNVKRIHGGLRLMEENNKDSNETVENIPYQKRKNKNIELKKIVAEEAFKLIEDGDVIFLDAGTTVLQISNLIKKGEFDNLSVITNSIEIAYDLSYSNVNLKVLGGDLKTKTFALVGRETEEALQKIWVDKVFLATSGVNFDYGLTSTDVFQANLKNKLMEVSKEIILVTDSSKINKNALNRVSKLNKVDKLITDYKADREFIERTKNLGVEVIIANK